MQEILNLTDQSGNRIGSMEKMAAHRTGALHEAFSIFIVNSQGETMLQKCSRKKYHSGGLWSNACCGHPRAGEQLQAAAHRRLREEMGFDCALSEAFSFAYRKRFPNGLVEHEFDHVFIGRYERSPRLNKKEASDWKWSALSRVERDLSTMSDAYTHWFKLAFPRFVDARGKYKKDLVLRDYVPISEAIENLARLRDERVYKVSSER